MPSGFNAGLSIRSQSITPRNKKLAGILLLAGGIAWLAFHAKFAQYALTGLSWNQAAGTVTSRDVTSIPTVQFVASDGAVYSFTEDYFLLCGRQRGFCLRRTFEPGQTVPVVYDPDAPKWAYIHDWALLANVGAWFALALICLCVPWVAFSGPPARVSMRLSRETEAD